MMYQTLMRVEDREHMTNRITKTFINRYSCETFIVNIFVIFEIKQAI